MFITFEGIEGCGKSTQARLLFESMKNRGAALLLTREPGGTKIGKEIRQILMSTSNSGLCSAAEFLLIEADRAQHVAEVIRPALDKGILVICDRFCDATVAYQGYGRGLDLNLIDKLNRFSSAGIYPNKTFLLDCPVEIGLKRALERNKETRKQAEGRFEAEDIGFHRKVREGYLALAQKEPGRFVVMDGTENREDLARKILAIVERLVEQD